MARSNKLIQPTVTATYHAAEVRRLESEADALRAELAKYQGEGADAWDIAEEHRQRADAAEARVKELEAVHKPCAMYSRDRIATLESELAATKRWLADEEGKRDEAEKRIAALEAENARLVEESNARLSNERQANQAMTNRWLATEAQLNGMREALEAALEHLDDHYRTTTYGETDPVLSCKWWSNKPCTCGLAEVQEKVRAALTSAPPEPAAKEKP